MNRCVLITGGAKGLGSYIVEEFAKNGYDIIFTYHKSIASALELKSSLETKYGTNVDAIQIDLENEEEIINLTSKIKDIDVLINNAAYNDDDDPFKKTGENFIKTYKVNTIAPFLLSKGFYEVLKKKHGNIINIASTNGIDTMYKESIDYDASKAALINMSQNLAKTFAPEIRVNTVAPGWIETEATKDMEDKFRNQEEHKILLGRFANAEEVAKLAYFLASDDASYINGSVIRIDGGTKHGN